MDEWLRSDKTVTRGNAERGKATRHLRKKEVGNGKRIYAKWLEKEDLDRKQYATHYHPLVPAFRVCTQFGITLERTVAEMKTERQEVIAPNHAS